MRSVDLTAEARIRRAALEMFPTRGVGGTTVRAIASAADVSPGLVLHHFGSKEGLLATCDRYVVETIRRYKTEPLADGSLNDPGFLAQIFSIAPPILRYLGWSLARGADAAAALFDEMLNESVRMFAVAEEQGIVKPTDDDTARAAVLLTMQLGFVVLHDHLSRALDTDVFEMDGLTRVTALMMDILTHGLFDPVALQSTRESLEAATEMVRRERRDS
ncbi:MAG TPA: TetR family transcriptional regulator [Acidimicrobiia bacterium]|nr:TetR family transcriptional regulator [Acidimicrobiia bacterium]